MKYLLLSIVTLFFVNPALAGDSDGVMDCLRYEPEQIIGIHDEVVFSIEGCSQEEIGSDIKGYMLYQSGYDFEWYGDGNSSIKKAIKLLRTDHSESDGSYAMKEGEIEKVLDYYFSDEASEDVMMAEFADSYMSGTGITQMVYLFNADKTKLIMLEKFTYAE